MQRKNIEITTLEDAERHQEALADQVRRKEKEYAAIEEKRRKYAEKEAELVEKHGPDKGRAIAQALRTKEARQKAYRYVRLQKQVRGDEAKRKREEKDEFSFE